MAYKSKTRCYRIEFDAFASQKCNVDTSAVLQSCRLVLQKIMLLAHAKLIRFYGHYKLQQIHSIIPAAANQTLIIDYA